MDLKSPRIGGLPKEAPAEARSVGAADQNESTPAEQRRPEGHNIPKTPGPRMDGNGAYLPAEYQVKHVVELKDGSSKEITLTRQDR